MSARAIESKEVIDKYVPDFELDRAEIQPFDVKISPDVAFITDLHAHLSNSEIIGLLGGEYDKIERCMYIQSAFPCKATERLDGGFTDVEMDPMSQMFAGEAIKNQGMKIVGWYHSHPKFQPDPSVVDIQNQSTYQQLFDASPDNPFVGLIVGTYDGEFGNYHFKPFWLKLVCFHF